MIDTDKYEPQNHADIFYGNTESKLRIEDIVSGATPFPAFGKCGILIFGTFGTGKTALARMLPAEIECGRTHQELAMPFEFIRCKQGFTGPQVMSLLEKVLSKVSLNSSGLHYVVLDEVDHLTPLAQRSLKSVMNTEHAIFVLTTNYLNEIDKGVINRSVLVELNAASHQQLAGHIQRITADLNVVLNDSEITDIVESSRGSVRDATHDAIRRANRKLRDIAPIG